MQFNLARILKTDILIRSVERYLIAQLGKNSHVHEIKIFNLWQISSLKLHIVGEVCVKIDHWKLKVTILLKLEF